MSEQRTVSTTQSDTGARAGDGRHRLRWLVLPAGLLAVAGGICVAIANASPAASNPLPLRSLRSSPFAAHLVAVASRRGRRSSGVSAARQIASQTVTTSADTEPDTVAEVYVAIDRRRPNRVLAVYQEGRVGSGAALAEGYAWSRDRGRTWRTRAMPWLTKATRGPFAAQADNVAAFGPDGTAYALAVALTPGARVNCSRSAIAVQRSRDGGAKFDRPTIVAGARSCRFSLDKGWIAVDNDPHSRYFGRVYVAWSYDDSQTSDSTQVMRYSDDRGRRWSRPTAISGRRSITSGIQLATRPDGSLIAVYSLLTSTGGQAIIERKSTDGGARFGRPVTVGRIVGLGTTEIQAPNFFPAVAVDPSTGRIFVAWEDGRFRHRPDDNDILISASNDGRRWTRARRVNRDPAGDRLDHLLPALSAYGGRVYVSFVTHRAGSPVAATQIATSRDGGGQFTPARRLGPTIDLRYSAKHVVGSPFLGDYMGIAADRGVVIPAWTVASRPSTPRTYHQTAWTARITP